ncbi:MAG: M23 family metallopeptidase [Candidatus Berkelbacteria bacterium]
MKKYFWIIISVLIVAVLTGGFFTWRYYKNKKTASAQAAADAAFIQSNPSVPVTPTPTSVVAPVPTYVYPITNFASRATTNLFGTYYPSGGSDNPDRKVCPSAVYYAGYHTAIDLETTSSETNQNVPVFAVAAGTVRQISAVTGYGGLIVVGYNLGGADYTAYYGHIDLSTAKVKNGDTVTVGETLASLGAACSTSNGDVRKHLHFGLHRGTEIVANGYVTSKSDLASWADPVALLSSLSAQ